MQANCAVQQHGKTVLKHPLLDRLRSCSATPDDAADFFTRALCPSSEMRLTAAQALAHPYLQRFVAQMRSQQRHTAQMLSERCFATLASMPVSAAPPTCTPPSVSPTKSQPVMDSQSTPQCSAESRSLQLKLCKRQRIHHVASTAVHTAAAPLRLAKHAVGVVIRPLACFARAQRRITAAAASSSSQSCITTPSPDMQSSKADIIEKIIDDNAAAFTPIPPFCTGIKSLPLSAYIPHYTHQAKPVSSKHLAAAQRTATTVSLVASAHSAVAPAQFVLRAATDVVQAKHGGNCSTGQAQHGGTAQQTIEPSSAKMVKPDSSRRSLLLPVSQHAEASPHRQTGKADSHAPGMSSAFSNKQTELAPKLACHPVTFEAEEEEEDVADVCASPPSRCTPYD